MTSVSGRSVSMKGIAVVELYPSQSTCLGTHTRPFGADVRVDVDVDASTAATSPQQF